VEEKEPTLTEMVTTAQLEKLNLEIRALRDKGNWQDTFKRLSPLISVLIAVGGFLFGVFQYYKEQEKAQANEETDQRIKIQAQIHNDLVSFFSQDFAGYNGFFLELDHLCGRHLQATKQDAKDEVPHKHASQHNQLVFNYKHRLQSLSHAGRQPGRFAGDGPRRHGLPLRYLPLRQNLCASL